MKSYRVHEILVTPFVSRGRIRISKKKNVGDCVLRRSVRNSHSRCGCGGAQVFECVDDPMPTVERRRFTLDDRDDRGRDPGPGERPEGELEFSDPTFGRNKKILSNLWTEKKTYRRRRHEEEGDEREKKTTRRNKDVMNECSWIVLLIVLEVSPGGPPDVPSWTPRKPSK